MPNAPPHRLTSRDRLVLAGLVLAAVLTAAPGVHAFELWLPARAAFVVSHGLALLLLAVTACEWRRRAARGG